jgi:hypothetical protein
MPTNNPRKYTVTERVFHRVAGVVGTRLEHINRQHAKDYERTGGSQVEVPLGSWDIGTRKMNAVLNEYTASEQGAIRDFLQRLLQDSSDASSADSGNEE